MSVVEENATTVQCPVAAGRSSTPSAPASLAVRARPWLVPGALAALGAVLFTWRLGASSFFIDEATSLTEARGSLAHLLSAVRLHETSPPTYAVFLHVWLGLFGSHGEVVARLPSALAGVGLVLAVWYLARLLIDPPAALIAALLTLCSPLVLEYAQQARVYAMVMLVATVTAIAALKAVRQSSGRWLVASAFAAVLTVSLHYIGWFEVAPLAVWVASQTSISVRSRISFCAVLAATGVLWLPELIGQLASYAHDGYSTSLGAWAGFSRANAIAVLGAPFHGRAAAPYAGPIGVGVVLATLALLAAPRARNAVRERGLAIALAATPLAAILVLGLAGKNIVIPRYGTVAVPFLAVAVAFALRQLRPRVAVPAAALILTAMTLGVRDSFSASSAYPNARGVIDAVSRHWRATDFLYPDRLPIGAYVPLAYYAGDSVPDFHRALWGNVYSPAFAAKGLTGPVGTASLDDAYVRARARRDRLWIVADYNGVPPSVATLLPPGYRALRVTDFTAGTSLTLLLAAPLR
jgi:mannosyltransferase